MLCVGTATNLCSTFYPGADYGIITQTPQSFAADVDLQLIYPETKL